MSVDPVAAVIGAVGCGGAALLVPSLIRRIPELAPETEAPPDAAKTPYAAIAAEPTLLAVAVGCCLVAGGLVGASVGLAWPLIFLLPLVVVGFALAIVDLRTRLLPTAVVWPTFLGVAALGCLSAWLESDGDALVRAWLGAGGVFAVFFALWWIHPPGMGFGDVRLSAVLGFALAYLGWGELLIGIYGAFLAFAVPGLVVAVFRRDRGLLKAAYPFGPFLLVGALAGVVLGDPLWSGLATG